MRPEMVAIPIGRLGDPHRLRTSLLAVLAEPARRRRVGGHTESISRGSNTRTCIGVIALNVAARFPVPSDRQFADDLADHCLPNRAAVDNDVGLARHDNEHVVLKGALATEVGTGRNPLFLSEVSDVTELRFGASAEELDLGQKVLFGVIT
jgi:hypothetical protein